MATVSPDRLFSYKGRATRRELLAVGVATLVAITLSGGLVYALWGKWIGDAPFSDDLVESTMARVIILLDLVPIGGLLATMSRRLHDIGRSGVWLLLAIALPIAARDIWLASQSGWSIAATIVAIGGIGLCVPLAMRGDAGQNAYGADPRSVDAPLLQRIFS